MESAWIHSKVVSAQKVLAVNSVKKVYVQIVKMVSAPVPTHANVSMDGKELIAHGP